MYPTLGQLVWERDNDTRTDQLVYNFYVQINDKVESEVNLSWPKRSNRDELKWWHIIFNQPVVNLSTVLFYAQIHPADVS